MQEWMIAMLVISIMLIIRDMAKTILAENLPDTERTAVSAGGPSSEREGGEVCGIFSETGRYFLRDALSERYLSSRQVEQII